MQKPASDAHHDHLSTTKELCFGITIRQTMLPNETLAYKALRSILGFEFDSMDLNTMITAFSEIDKDSSGELSLEELTICMRATGTPDRQIEHAIRRLGVKGPIPQLLPGEKARESKDRRLRGSLGKDEQCSKRVLIDNNANLAHLAVQQNTQEACVSKCGHMHACTHFYTHVAVLQKTTGSVFEDLAQRKMMDKVRIDFATFVQLTNKALFDDNKSAARRASRRFLERARLQQLGRVELRLDQVIIPEEEHEDDGEDQGPCAPVSVHVKPQERLAPMTKASTDLCWPNSDATASIQEVNSAIDRLQCDVFELHSVLHSRDGLSDKLWEVRQMLQKVHQTRLQGFIGFKDAHWQRMQQLATSMPLQESPS